MPPFPRLLRRSPRPKVIGIGFHKTGTTSLKLALEMLGYTVTGPNATDNPRIAEEAFTLARTLLKKFDAAQDNPWPMLYREIDTWYPGTKFVLTVRPTEKWLRSTVSFFGSKTTPMREWIYGAGHGSPLGHEQIYAERYERHNREVNEYFRNRPDDLLVLDLTQGNGWEQLCPFLGKPVPATPFPHANSAAAPFRAARFASGLRRRLRSFLRSKR